MNAQNSIGVIGLEIKDEFKDLYKEFVDSYLLTAKGKEHTTLPLKSRNEAVENFDQIKNAFENGENITPLVLLKLLPHKNTEHNRAKGAWIHVAPAINKDIYTWFENKGWVSKSDWPEIAKAIYRFVSKCIDAHEDLDKECEAFFDNPKTKGMQAGS